VSITHHFSTVKEACSDSSFFATITNYSVTLKQYHKHYYQIQGQMTLRQVSWCDFVICTHQSFTVTLWGEMQPNLTIILPKRYVHNKDN